MEVMVRHLPFHLEYPERGKPRFALKSGGYIDISYQDAVQFEILAKLDNIEESNAKIYFGTPM